jgi:hypothetical protein
MKKSLILVLVSVFLLGVCAASQAKVLDHGSSVIKVSEDINVGEKLRFKDLIAIRGDINVKGTIDNDIFALLGDIHLFPTAKVGGNVVVIGGRIVKDPGAIVSGDVVETIVNEQASEKLSGYLPSTGLMFFTTILSYKIIMFLGFLALAILLSAFMTKQVGLISYKIESNWLKALLWGILGGLLICPLAGLLAITILGIPLILVEGVIVSIALVLGLAAVSQLIGKKVLKAFRRGNKPMIVEVVLGLTILALIDLIPIVGMIIKVIALTIGFGGALATRLGYQS